MAIVTNFDTELYLRSLKRLVLCSSPKLPYQNKISKITKILYFV